MIQKYGSNVYINKLIKTYHEIHLIPEKYIDKATTIKFNENL